MSLAIVHSRSQANINAPLITIETHLSNGLPKFTIVGLPEAAIRESRDRVRSAILSSNLNFPVRHITVNLAPADLPKEGSSFDLAIALGILAASNQIPATSLDEYEFIAELALSGELRPIKGILPAAMATRNQHKKLIISPDNIPEASLCKGLEILAADNILQICAHLQGQQCLTPITPRDLSIKQNQTSCISEVREQQQAKRALELCALGGHNILFYGPPGTGKTMLSHKLTSLLPTLSEQQALEVAAIYSLSNLGFDENNWRQRPFRAPHHSASMPAIVGGSNPPKPGEISLAHNGVLFLDELPEYQRTVLESLREPLESASITIARAAHHVQFPADFQLITAMNPCPCGQLGNRYQQCVCTPDQIRRYRARLSGPLLDRIDIWCAMPQIDQTLLLQPSPKTTRTSEEIRSNVVRLREQQLQRQGCLNAKLSVEELTQQIPLSSAVKQILQTAFQEFQLSSRSYHRVLRIARSIADLGDSKEVEVAHMLEALSYRQLMQK